MKFWFSYHHPETKEAVPVNARCCVVAADLREATREFRRLHQFMYLVGVIVPSGQWIGTDRNPSLFVT